MELIWKTLPDKHSGKHVQCIGWVSPALFLHGTWVKHGHLLTHLVSAVGLTTLLLMKPFCQASLSRKWISTLMRWMESWIISLFALNCRWMKSQIQRTSCHGLHCMIMTKPEAARHRCNGILWKTSPNARGTVMWIDNGPSCVTHYKITWPSGTQGPKDARDSCTLPQTLGPLFAIGKTCGSTTGSFKVSKGLTHCKPSLMLGKVAMLSLKPSISSATLWTCKTLWLSRPGKILTNGSDNRNGQTGKHGLRMRSIARSSACKTQRAQTFSSCCNQRRWYPKLQGTTDAPFRDTVMIKISGWAGKEILHWHGSANLGRLNMPIRQTCSVWLSNPFPAVNPGRSRTFWMYPRFIKWKQPSDRWVIARHPALTI